MTEDINNLDEAETRQRLGEVLVERRRLESLLGLKCHSYIERKFIKDQFRDIEHLQRKLKTHLHLIAQSVHTTGSITRGANRVKERPEPVEIPDEGYLATLTVQRGVVDAFRIAYKSEGERLAAMIAEGVRRGLLNPDGTPATTAPKPGEIPTLEESGKPLGYVSGYHNSPGPHFPHHDVRRIYKK